jgi:hypothetical protein
VEFVEEPGAFRAARLEEGRWNQVFERYRIVIRSRSGERRGRTTCG